MKNQKANKINSLIKHCVGITALLALVFCLLFAGAEEKTYVNAEESQETINARSSSIIKATTETDIQNAESNGFDIAILAVDKDLNVVLETGSMTLESAVSNLKSVMLAVVIDTAEVSLAVVDFATTMALDDIYFVGSDTAILKSAKTSYPKARVVFDATNMEDIESAFDVTAPTQSALGSIVILPAECLQEDFVRKVRSRFTTVWADGSDVDSIADANSILQSGVHGIIELDCNYTLQASQLLSGQNIVARSPIIVGHRGATYEENSYPTSDHRLPENSISAVLFASENSADVIEIDVRLSKDNEIVLMHDATLNRTMNVSGTASVNVADLTLAQLKEYEYNSDVLEQYADERIPTLAEVLDAVKDIDVVIIIELKSSEATLPTLVAKEVQTAQMQKNVIFTTFYSSLATSIKTILPECCSSILVEDIAKSSLDDDDSVAESVSDIASKTNYGEYVINTAYDNYNQKLIDELSVRGVSFNAYTYVFPAIKSMHMVAMVGAMTCDAPQSFNDLPKYIEISTDSLSIMASSEIKFDELSVKTYSDNSYEYEKLSAIIVGGDESGYDSETMTFTKGGQYQVIFTCNYVDRNYDYSVASNVVSLTVEENSGCGAVLDVGGSIAIVIVLIAVSIIALLPLYIKRTTKK